jgi:hypothetical protein
LKKYQSYILAGVVAVAIIFLFLTSENKASRQFDGRVTLRVKDKIPYGTYAAFESLKHLFPKADVMVNRQQPGLWDSLSGFDGNQALVIVARYFNADEFEMKKLIRFVENGNDVFISAMEISYEATRMMRCDVNAADGMMYYFEQSEGADLLSVSLAQPPFIKKTPYTYPGKR